MRVRVQIDPRCRFDIGERTPEIRALVKEYVKAFIEYAGRHGGHMPGDKQVDDEPPTFVWKDANWFIGYTVEVSARTIVTNITDVRLFAGGGSS